MEDNLGQPTWHIVTRKQRILGPLLLATLAGIFYLDWYYVQSTSTKESGTSVLHHPPTVPTIVAFRNTVDDYHLPECKHPSRSFENDTTVQEVRGWHRVDPRSDWHVYSAYPDNRSSVPVVRIITLSKDDAGSPLLYCLFWHGAKDPLLPPVQAQKQELWIRAWDSARPGQYYHPFVLTCPVPEDSPPISAVSVLVKEPCSRPNHRILLMAPRQPPSDDSGHFVVCLKSLNFVRDIGARLLEWLELQYLLGADTIYAYVHRLHPTTWKVLEHYRRLGQFNWLNYTGIPEEMASRPEDGKPSHRVWQKRRYEMAMYNDCFYRHLHSHRFVVNLDLDEVIVPVLGDSWSEMMASDEPPLSASLSVRNVYFFDTFGEVDDIGIPRHMRMLRHVVRSSNFTPPGFAQKSFFSTRLAEVVSNHYALKSVRPDIRLLTGMDAKVARLHHYRSDCPPLMQKECEENYMRFRERDTLLWKFKDRLIVNVLSRMRQLGLHAETSEEPFGLSTSKAQKS